MNELSRLKELYRYHILDTKPEAELDELAEIASVIFDTPMSFNYHGRQRPFLAQINIWP